MTEAYSYLWPNDEPSNTGGLTDPKVQQLFLNCTQFFTTTGINQIFDKIRRISEENVSTLLLNKPFSSEDMGDLLEKAMAKIQSSYGANNFSDLVIPQKNISVRIYFSLQFNLVGQL